MRALLRRFPAFFEAIAALSKDAPFMLINTHWHQDHTGGNEGLHAAGFTIAAHRIHASGSAAPQTMKLFHRDDSCISGRGVADDHF